MNNRPTWLDSETGPVDQPLVLKRLRANVKQQDGSSQSPPEAEPVNGVMIWIEGKREGHE